MRAAQLVVVVVVGVSAWTASANKPAMAPSSKCKSDATLFDAARKRPTGPPCKEPVCAKLVTSNIQNAATHNQLAGIDCWEEKPKGVFTRGAAVVKTLPTKGVFYSVEICTYVHFFMFAHQHVEPSTPTSGNPKDIKLENKDYNWCLVDSMHAWCMQGRTAAKRAYQPKPASAQLHLANTAFLMYEDGKTISPASVFAMAYQLNIFRKDRNTHATLDFANEPAMITTMTGESYPSSFTCEELYKLLSGGSAKLSSMTSGAVKSDFLCTTPMVCALSAVETHQTKPTKPPTSTTSATTATTPTAPPTSTLPPTSTTTESADVGATGMEAWQIVVAALGTLAGWLGVAAVTNVVCFCCCFKTKKHDDAKPPTAKSSSKSDYQSQQSYAGKTG